MRKFPRRRAIEIGTVAIIALALGATSLRAAPAEAPAAFDVEAFADFSVEDADVFPRAVVEKQTDDAPLTPLVPPEPARAADPAINLVPLPAPLMPAIIGVTFLAARFAMRRRRNSAAGVFRRRR
jgi:hypothetical protein